MNHEKLLSILFLLAISHITVNAQQRHTIRTSGPATTMPAPAVNAPIKIAPPAPAIVSPAKGKYHPPDAKPFSAAGSTKMIEEQKNNEIEKRIAFEHSKGIITINFGIVKQGEQTQAFCPFNITTLESKETTRTPGVNISFLKKYSLWNNPSSISNVTVGFGPLMAPYKGAAKGADGNGFFVTYAPTTQPGAVDEMITFFTSRGNITYRLLGYIYIKDGETTVSK